MSIFMPKLEKGLHFRRLHDTDLPRINELWDGSYDLEVKSSNIGDAVVIQNDDIAGFGIIKEFAEVVLVLNKDLSKRDQIQVLKKLYDRAVHHCKDLKLKELHAFVKDEQFAQLLIKHFGFRKIEGIPLILDLRNERPWANHNNQKM